MTYLTPAPRTAKDGLGLMLAVSGLFGLMAHHAEQRRHEVGLRMAMGATGMQVTRLFVLHGMRLALIGIVAGTMATMALTRAVKSFLSGVSPSDPLTYAVVAVLLLTVALMASWIPARRAARTDPIVALRHG